MIPVLFNMSNSTCSRAKQHQFSLTDIQSSHVIRERCNIWHGLMTIAWHGMGSHQENKMGILRAVVTIHPTLIFNPRALFQLKDHASMYKDIHYPDKWSRDYLIGDLYTGKKHLYFETKPGTPIWHAVCSNLSILVTGPGSPSSP